MSEYSFRQPAKGIKPKLSKDSGFLVTRELKEKLVHSDPKNPFDFNTTKELVETKRVSQDEYVASFLEEYLFENILRRAVESGNIDSLAQFGPQKVSSPVVNDYTDMPKDVTEAYNKVIKGRKLAQSMPKELRGNKSIEEFMKTVTAEDLIAFVTERNKKQNEVKEVDK